MTRVPPSSGTSIEMSLVVMSNGWSSIPVAEINERKRGMSMGRPNPASSPPLPQSQPAASARTAKRVRRTSTTKWTLASCATPQRSVILTPAVREQDREQAETGHASPDTELAASGSLALDLLQRARNSEGDERFQLAGRL